MINVVVEGESDRELAKSILKAAGKRATRVLVTGGTGRLDARLPKYCAAAAQHPWVVFRDSDAACPVDLRAELTASITAWEPKFELRIAHSMSEAWLLADKASFATYFKVPVNRIPSDVESLPHAKRAVLDLCARSRSRQIREDMTAKGNQTGPLYVRRINEFAEMHWDPHVAAESSDSLRRAIERIASLPEA